MILVAASGAGLAWARYNYEWDAPPPLRPEPSWIDRLGRLLGIAWFLSNATNAARVALYSW